MEKICDHTSVGMLVWKGDKLLLIERARFPKGFAIPAGHVDGDPTYEDAARRELKEEVGLDATGFTLVAEGRKENPCRRKDGTWHYWKLYRATTTGDVNRSQDETKQANWYSKDEIKSLAERTEKYRKGDVTDDAWNDKPGLEPIMYDWFKELTIIQI
jgi:ADP-ribose pyrophosphatase YjhB (NUDIX family)